MKRILILHPTLPEPTSGGRARAYFLTKGLVDQGYEVSAMILAAPTDQEQLNHLESLGIRVFPVNNDARPAKCADRSLPLRIWDRLRMVLRAFWRHPHSACFQWVDLFRRALVELADIESFDLILVEHFESVLLVDALPNRVKRVLSAHNIHSHYYDRQALISTKLRVLHYFEMKTQAHKWRQLEKRALREYDSIIVTSRLDRDRLGAQGVGSPVFVVENGVDTSSFTRSSEEDESPSLLFTGLMGYEPNHDGIVWFIQKILPLILLEIPHVRLDIVGASPQQSLQRIAARHPAIRLTGWVKSTQPYFDAAQVVVAPLRMGGGTRLKILEAAAMQKAIVATPVAAEGLDGLKDGEHLLLREHPDEFARAVIALLKDRRYRNGLGQRARLVAESYYDWVHLSEKLEKCLLQTTLVEP